MAKKKIRWGVVNFFVLVTILLLLGGFLLIGTGVAVEVGTSLASLGGVLVLVGGVVACREQFREEDDDNIQKQAKAVAKLLGGSLTGGAGAEPEFAARGDNGAVTGFLEAAEMGGGAGAMIPQRQSGGAIGGRTTTEVSTRLREAAPTTTTSGLLDEVDRTTGPVGDSVPSEDSGGEGCADDDGFLATDDDPPLPGAVPKFRPGGSLATSRQGVSRNTMEG